MLVIRLGCMSLTLRPRLGERMQRSDLTNVDTDKRGSDEPDDLNQHCFLKPFHRRRIE